MISEKNVITKLLAVLFPKAKIYLFGSRARGTHKPSSDIDLALDDNGNKIESLEIVKAKNMLDALNIPQKIDLVDFNSVPQELQQLILKEGIVWKD